MNTVKMQAMWQDTYNPYVGAGNAPGLGWCESQRAGRSAAAGSSTAYGCAVDHVSRKRCGILRLAWISDHRSSSDAGVELESFRRTHLVPYSFASIHTCALHLEVLSLVSQGTFHSFSIELFYNGRDSFVE